MKTQWFVIQTLAGQEQKVKDSIEKRIKTEEMQDYVKEVLVPMERVVEVRGGKKTVSTRKLWPGYVFIEMALLDENNRIIEKPWYFIKETQGVIGFVGGHEHRFPRPTQDLGDFFVGGGDAMFAVDDHDDDVGILHGHQRLSADLRDEFSAALSQRRGVTRAFRLVDFDTAGIDDSENRPAPVEFSL
ncbi:MAG: transcription termination/antitermination NusG family protein [Verrucomicrobiales bacterium]|nr:transcription termination/antitermination NusG family protein [Verrucomicrobiales bacterium]